MNNLLTVFADASFIDRDGICAGGYAYWARGAGPERVQGAAPWECKGIDEAETVGLAVAVMEAVEKLDFCTGGSIIIQSDSLVALGCFYWCGVGTPAKTSDRPIGRKQGNQTAETFVREAKRILVPYAPKVWLKHVKAHTGKDEPRSWVNDWCDRESKKARRALYDRLRNAHNMTVEGRKKIEEGEIGCQI